MATDGEESAIAAQLARVRQLLSGSEPAGSPWLVTPVQGQAYAVGTTVPLLQGSFESRPSGLLIPAGAVRRPYPIDLMAAYLTIEEVYGVTLPGQAVADALTQISCADALIWCARLLASRQTPGRNQTEFDRELVMQWFSGQTASRVTNLVNQGRVLCTPQGLLQLAKLAVKYCPQTAAEGARSVSGPALLLAVQSGLAEERHSRSPDRLSGIDVEGPLVAEVISNQDFNRSPDEAGVLAGFNRRWRELPGELSGHPGWVDLEAAYRDATSVSLIDMTIIGTGFWAASVGETGVWVTRHWFSNLGWKDERLQNVLALLSADIETLRDLVLEHEASFGTEWSFDAFRRYPVVRLADDGLLVLSPELVLQRVFGWLPLFDLALALKESGRPREADRAVGFFRHICEVHALESLRHIVGDSKAGQRLWGGEELRIAYGQGGQLADAAIDYGDAWVVVEISTRQLTRQSIVGGSLGDLQRDIQLGVEAKVAQIDATIRRLRADETKLTGRPAVPRRRYFAVLVITEGFPVNPITNAAVASGLKEQRLLEDPRIGPLHMLIQQDLDLLEAATGQMGANLAQLLEGHEAGNLRHVGMQEWLLSERRADIVRTSRIDAGFKKVLEPTIEALRAGTGENK